MCNNPLAGKGQVTRTAVNIERKFPFYILYMLSQTTYITCGSDVRPARSSLSPSDVTSFPVSGGRRAEVSSVLVETIFIHLHTWAHFYRFYRINLGTNTHLRRSHPFSLGFQTSAGRKAAVNVALSPRGPFLSVAGDERDLAASSSRNTDVDPVQLSRVGVSGEAELQRFCCWRLWSSWLLMLADRQCQRNKMNGSDLSTSAE